MFGLPAFYVAGKLFACVYGDGVGLKLPAERVAALLDRPGVAPFRPYGKPAMRQWIQLTRSSADDYAGDLELLLESARFVGERAATASGGAGIMGRRSRGLSRGPTVSTRRPMPGSRRQMPPSRPPR